MKQKMKNLFLKYNMILSDKQVDAFEQYYQLLIEWNQKFNLTAITDPDEVILKHFLDSVLMINQIPHQSSIVDVGSGAGFPGIPIKILRDDVRLVMVDSLQKRVNFLNEVISNLNLTQTKAVHARGEDFARLTESRERFDVCVSRAVARLSTLSEVCLPLVKVGGLFIPSKSKESQQELLEAKNAIAILGGVEEKLIEIHIQENDSYRSFPVIKKIKPTSNKYPRDKNLPKTKPLK